MVREGMEVSIAGFVGICRELEAQGAHNVQILSPTVHFPALRLALLSLKESGFTPPIVLKSSGYENVEQLRRMEGLVDIYLPDFKFGPCSGWAARAGVRNYFETARSALDEMIRQVGGLRLGSDGLARGGVLVRHVRAPLPPEEKRFIEDFLRQLPDGVAVSFNDHFTEL
jgi:putative pyruvate formate lyase activating enzyme